MVDFKDYYAILGVNISSSSEQIKKAYRIQLKKWHPDTNSDSSATEKTKDIIEAYLLLNDSQARVLYDLEYIQYNRLNNEFKSNQEKEKINSESKTKEANNYSVIDDQLNEWILNARKQASEFFEETIDLTKIGLTTGSYSFLENLVIYFIMSVIASVLFLTCN